MWTRWFVIYKWILSVLTNSAKKILKLSNWVPIALYKLQFKWHLLGIGTACAYLASHDVLRNNIYFRFRLHGHPAAHYESASTRRFHGGRTETIRSCLPEIVDFANVHLKQNRSPQEKYKALQAAINAHKEYVGMVTIPYVLLLAISWKYFFTFDRPSMGKQLTAIF